MRDFALFCISLAAGFGLGVLWRSKYQLMRYRSWTDRAERAERAERRKMWDEIYR